MRTRHGLAPTALTYTALMQALAACGRLGEGFALLRDFEAAGLADIADTADSYAVHRTLLEACRSSGTAAQVTNGVLQSRKFQELFRLFVLSCINAAFCNERLISSSSRDLCLDISEEEIPSCVSSRNSNIDE